MINIELPKALGLTVEGKSKIEIDDPCATVGDALRALGKRAPGVLDRIVDEQGNLRPHVNVFKNGESIRFLRDLQTFVREGDSVLVVAAISGGLHLAFKPPLRLYQRRHIVARAHLVDGTHKIAARDVRLDASAFVHRLMTAE